MHSHEMPESNQGQQSSIELLPDETVLNIASNLCPWDAVRFFSTSRKYADISNTHWQDSLKTYYLHDYKAVAAARAKRKNITNVDWKSFFADCYEQISVEYRQLSHILAVGDLENFIRLKYTFNDISKIIPSHFDSSDRDNDLLDRLGYHVILFAVEFKRQAILNYIYNNLVIPYYRKGESNELDLNKEDDQGNTLLHWAVRLEQPCDMIEKVFGTGSLNGSLNFLKLNKEGFTPLHIAIQNDNLTLVEFLLPKAKNLFTRFCNFNFNVWTEGNYFPFSLSRKNVHLMQLVMRFNNINIIKYLIDDYVSDTINNEYRSHLVEDVKLNCIKSNKPMLDIDLLKSAVRGGCLKLVKHFINNYHFYFYSKSGLTYTLNELLRIAIKRNYLDIVKFIVEGGYSQIKLVKMKLNSPVPYQSNIFDINSPINYSNDNPLQIAVASGHLNIVTYLINRGARTDVVTDIWRGTLLHIAIKHDHIHIIKFLINYGLRFNAYDYYRTLSVLNDAAERGYLDAIKYLLTIDHSKYLITKYGNSMLDHAVKHGHTELAAYLLEKGAATREVLAHIKYHNEDKIYREIFAKAKLQQYIAERGAESAPEYKTSFTFFCKTFNFGWSKTEKVAAAKAMLNGKDLTKHKGAANQGGLGKIHALLHPSRGG